MKKFSVFIIMICLFLSSFLFVSCKGKEDIKSAETKMYYKNSGYVNLSISSDLKISSNKKDNVVYFDDNTIMVKSGSEYSVRPKDTSFKLYYNNIFANFKTSQILKIVIDEIEISNGKENTIDMTVTSKTKIESKMLNFGVVGIASLYITNPGNETKIYFSNNTLTCIGGSLFYATLKSDSDLSTPDEYDFNSNIEFNVKSVGENSKANLIFTFEDPQPDCEKLAYVILKDTNGDLYLCNMNYETMQNSFTLNNTKSDDFKFDTITLNFAYDTETKSEYER